MKPHLVMKLKPGWRYDSGRRLFVTARGKSVSPGEGLPEGAAIRYMVPDLAGRAPESLSKDERDLALFFHILMPEGADPRDYLDEVGRWECTEDVHLPPEISLP